MKAIISTTEGRRFEKPFAKQGDAVNWIIFEMQKLALNVTVEGVHNFLGMNEFFKDAKIEGSDTADNANKLINSRMRNINMDIFLDSEKYYVV